MKRPGIFDVRSVARLSQLCTHAITRSDGSTLWVPERPTGYQSIFQRWRAAWMVFTGRADALTWPEQ